MVNHRYQAKATGKHSVQLEKLSIFNLANKVVQTETSLCLQFADDNTPQ